MIPLKQAVSSSIVKKLITALTGVGLVGFVIAHLFGNLTLLIPDGGQTFNAYTKNLYSLGALLVVLEVGLAAFFVFHVVNGVRLKLNHWRARPVGYVRYQSKGGPTKSNFSSRNMALSGFVLLVFTILHVVQFRLGPGVAEGYVTDLKGEQVRDLYRLVVETFQSPLVVAIYVGSVLFLGLHLRHGFWSMFQSLGAINPRLSGPIYCVGVLMAVLLAVGFLLLPLWIFFDMGAMLR